MQGDNFWPCFIWQGNAFMLAALGGAVFEFAGVEYLIKAFSIFEVFDKIGHTKQKAPPNPPTAITCGEVIYL